MKKKYPKSLQILFTVLFFLTFQNKSFAQTCGTFTTIKAGWHHTLAIKQDGRLWTWGYNSDGQLGDGTITDRPSPVPIGTATDWVSVSGGQYHSLALKSNGTLWAWGANVQGQLGNGTTNPTLSPIQIGTATDWALISAGASHNLALKSNGTLWAWGDNSSWQLGDGTNTNRTVPKQIGTATNWAFVSAGANHSLAIKTDGTLWSCGDNQYGQLGVGSTAVIFSTMTQVGTGSNWATVSAGFQFTLAVKTDGSLWGWGRNDFGQLGIGAGNPVVISPIQIGTNTNWARVAAGQHFSLATRTDGSLYSWGTNSFGELGNGTYTSSNTPGYITTPSSVSSLSSGEGYSVVLQTNGTYWGWGRFLFGRLGNGSVSGSTPNPSAIIAQLPAPAASSQNFCSNTSVASLVPGPLPNRRWYNVATGGTPLLATTTITTSGTYYIDSVYSAGCVSNRLAVSVSINTVPLPPVTNPQIFCGSTMVSNLVPAPLSNRRWYNVPTGGTPLLATAPITSSGTYYVDSVSVAGCVSNSRTAVGITINNVPAPPIAAAQSFNGITTVSNLVPAPLSNRRWFTTATGGTPLAAASFITTSGTYYVDTVNLSGCASIRTAVPITINQLPATQLDFDGVSNYVISNAVNIANQSFSMEFWHKRNLNAIGTYQYICSQGISATNQFMAVLFRSTNLLSFSFWNNEIDAVTPITDGNWHHYACTYNAASKLQSIYIDGVLNATRTATANTTASGQFFIGGYLGNSLILNGSVDELRCWNYDLTTTDINNRKNCELAGNENGLLRYYRFNQGLDGQVNTSVTSLTDGTAGANHGTLVNFALAGGTSNWRAGSPVTTGSIIPAQPSISPQSFCNGTTVANLIPAPSSTINWYSEATGGSPLAGTTAITATGTYYATSVNAGGCESARVPVYIMVGTVPVINPIGNQTVCNGFATTALNFTGTASYYNWTNDNTTIGLAVSGTGNIPAFTATNISGTAVTATITATPINVSMAYVANFSSNNVSVINTATNTITATIAVGTGPYAVSVSPDGSKVYVANSNSNNVSVINTATNTITATIVVGANPQGVSVSPDGSKVYVANLNSNNISVINTATNTVTATVALGTSPFGVSVSPDGSKVYVANIYSNNVSVINTATNTVTATVAVGANPVGVSVSPDGSKVYVANLNSDNISVINTATNTVTATVAVGTSPFGVSVSLDGSKVYVANLNSSNVSVINTATNTVTATVAVGSGPRGVSVSSDGSKVYVANANSSNVSVINTATNTVTATVAVGMIPISFGNFITNVPNCIGSSQSFTITVNPFTNATIATANASLTLPVTGITYFSNGCSNNLIAQLNPTGASPASGNTTAKVWIEAAQPAQFVKRHYEITPAAGASTATGRITLYFTQAEFDDFNAVNTIKLPTGASDVSGISNLLIEKRPGTSSDGTGLPGTYTGTPVTINPSDVDIVWNVTSSRWEVTFNVSGFSGFFVKTATSTLPVKLVSFSGARNAGINTLQWKTGSEVNTSYFELEYSIDGYSFSKIAQLTAAGIFGNSSYQYNHNITATGKMYYRLKMVDSDGKYSYSYIIVLNSKQNSGISIYPNPAKDAVMLAINDRSLMGTQFSVISANGKLVMKQAITGTAQMVNTAKLPAGIYLIKFADGSTVKMIKE
jgi:YVTN family beta-propeller protein